MARLICIILLSFIALGIGNVVPSTQSFVDHELVPDILSTAPLSVLSVTFPSGVEILEGNIVTLEDVNGLPTLDWNADPDVLYTVIMCDPDAPSRLEPEARSFLHWLVVNVPGSDINSGDTVVSFVHSQPEPGTGLHRYVFLVYDQPEEISLDGLPEDSFEGRINFSAENFADANNIGEPIAGNFYQTENLEDE